MDFDEGYVMFMEVLWKVVMVLVGNGVFFFDFCIVGFIKKLFS